MATDIPTAVRKQVHDRDGHRCRWCGRTNAGLHIHHINYRSAGGGHEPENLISLCVDHHQMVHTNKQVYPAMLNELLENGPGVTGLQVARWRKRTVVPITLGRSDRTA